MVYCLILTGTFMIAELLLGEMYIRDRSNLAKQIIIHHLIVIALVYMCLTIGTGAILIG